MLETKRTTPILALFGAVALMMGGAPAAFAQAAAAPAADAAAVAAAAPEATPAATDAVAPAATDAAAPAADAAAPAAEEGAVDENGEPMRVGGKAAGKLTIQEMFNQADIVVKIVMIGLVLASIATWTILVMKILELGALNKATDNFLDAFRGAKSIADINKIARSDEHAGNPFADMAAAAAGEIELSRQAGLAVGGEHRDSTIARAQTAIGAVQAELAKRLGGGQTFLASVGSGGPFIGLFGTVWGIMRSFIGIANTNTTNLAVVAPGIAEALLATAIGLFAAIPATIFYNYFQTRINGYGTRSEAFVSELTNALSRQLDKGN